MIDIYNPQQTKLTELVPKEVINDKNIMLVAKASYDDFLREQKTNLNFRADLTRESCIKAGMKWLEDVEMINFDAENDIDCLYEDIMSMISLREEDTHFGKPLVAIDLETTGLDRMWYIYGGQPRLPLAIIGVGIAIKTTDKELGMYIPVGHAETKNQDLNKVLKVVQKLIDNGQTVYHNGLYDREVLQLNGIKLNNNWCDTMLMAIAVGLRTGKTSRIGLKHLADTLLDRRMLEIDEVAEDGELYRLGSKSVYIYGCSDVINTLKLYKTFRFSGNYEDPYTDQKSIMNIDIQAADFTNSLNRFNYPIHMKNAEGCLRTTMRRVIILDRKIDNMSGHQIENLSSSEQIGIYIYKYVLKAFSREYFESDTGESRKKELIEKLKLMLEKYFKMSVTETTLKSGITKLKVNSGDEVLSAIMSNTDKLTFMTEDEQKTLYDFADLVSTKRSCEQSIGLLSKFVRFAYADDSLIPRLGTGLKFFGAITTRYSNEKGKGYNRIKFTSNTKGIKGKYIKGNGIGGINAQGIPSDPMKMVKARKLTKLPENVKKEIDKTTEITENAVREYLTYDI